MDPREAPGEWLSQGIAEVSDAATVALLAAVARPSAGNHDAWWLSIRDGVIAALLTAQERALGLAGIHAAAALDNATAGALTEGALLGPAPPELACTYGTHDLVEHLDATPRVIQARINDGMDEASAITRSINHLRAIADSEPGRLVRQSVADIATRKGSTGFEGWRRVATANACEFCLMLATRGAVYTSKQTAKTVQEGKRKGMLYHDHCHCRAEAITDPGEAERLAEEGRAAYEALGSPRFGRGGSGSKADRRSFQLNSPGAKTPERLALVKGLLAKCRPALEMSAERAATGSGLDLAEYDRWLAGHVKALEAERDLLAGMFPGV